MISRSYITKNLRMLDVRFRRSRSQKEALFFSKLALLELCGWIEESMDDVVRRCARRHLRDASNIKYVEDQVIKRTHGFEYDKHFRKMLIHVIGIVNVSRLERKVSEEKFTRLVASLNSLKGARNPEAHTHIKGATRHIDAPSATQGHFNPIYDGLVEFDRTLRSIKI